MGLGAEGGWTKENGGGMEDGQRNVLFKSGPTRG